MAPSILMCKTEMGTGSIQSSICQNYTQMSEKNKFENLKDILNQYILIEGEGNRKKRKI